ncbi:MAG: class I SAM-dependent methyltransferase [Deltaproteobacteria bacterium]|nr:class I SAM-dependent methyltransferase [Deltaproteobacteria bacterium]
MSLQERVSRGEVPDYNQDAASFAYLYYLSNFSKAAAGCSLVRSTLRRPRIDDVLSILDLGCGSGASTAAALLTGLSSGWRQIRICVVDSNQVQLDLARGIIDRLLPANSLVQVDYRHGDAEETLRSSARRVDLAVCSYLLCELPPEKSGRIWRALRRGSNPGAYVVVQPGVGIDSATIWTAGQRIGWRYPPGGLDGSFLTGLGLQHAPKTRSSPPIAAS